jgi:hypothetical protein
VPYDFQEWWEKYRNLEKEGKLPATVSQFGSTPEEIFVNWEDIKR